MSSCVNAFAARSEDLTSIPVAHLMGELTSTQVAWNGHTHLQINTYLKNSYVD